MATRPLILANAWGGTWGYSWFGAWGNDYGQWTAEIDEENITYGGKPARGRLHRRQYRHNEPVSDDVVRRQWDLLESKLRSQKEADKQEPSIPQEAVSAYEALPMPMAQMLANISKEAELRAQADAEIAEQSKARERAIRNKAALALILSQV